MFEPVEVFELSDLGIVALEAEDLQWSRVLDSGQEYTFAVRMDPQLPISLITNETPMHLIYDGDVASVTVRPTRGSVALAVRESESARRYHYLMRWAVE